MNELKLSDVEVNTILFALRFLEANPDLAMAQGRLDRPGEWVYCECAVLNGQALDELAESLK